MLLLMGAREGESALLALAAEERPGLKEEPALLEEALHEAAYAGAGEGVELLKSWYEGSNELPIALPEQLLHSALASPNPTAVEQLLALFPDPLISDPLSLLATAIRGGQVELFERVSRLISTDPPMRALLNKLRYSYLSEPMLKSLSAAYPALLATINEEDLFDFLASGHSLALLPWLHQERPDLRLKGHGLERVFIEALASGDQALVRAVREMIPDLALTQEMLYQAFCRGERAILEHVLELPMRQGLTPDQVKELLIGALQGGQSDSLARLLALYPDALEGIQGQDSAGNDWRYRLLWAAIASGRPDRVAWVRSFLDPAWLQKPGYRVALGEALERASLCVCQAVFALVPDQAIRPALLDKALLNGEQAVFDWLQSLAPCGVGPTPYGLSKLEKLRWKPNYTWVYELQERGISISLGEHHFQEAIHQGDLVIAQRIYQKDPEALAPLLLPILTSSRRGQEVLLAFVQVHKGQEEHYCSKTLLTHDREELPLELVGQIVGYLGAAQA